MSAHVCTPPYPLKQGGRCLCCGTDCYEVKQIRQQPGHPLDGHPVSLGRQLEDATQVTFLMSDGSTADVSFCLDCATNLRPAHYPAVWRACAERFAVGLRLAGRSDNELAVELAKYEALWPVAAIGKRREVDGLLAVDRRG